MEGNAGIYIIKNIHNGHRYIGESNDIRKRIKQHWQLLALNKHHNGYLQNSYNRWGGRSAFTFEVKEFIEDEWYRKEREGYWIRRLNAEYNLNPALSDYDGDDYFHDACTPYIKLGEKRKAPAWYEWVYGGKKSPCVTGEKVPLKSDEEQKSMVVTIGNKLFE